MGWAPPATHTPQRLWRLNPHAIGTRPSFKKILDPPLASAMVLAAAPTSAPSLGRRLEVDPAAVTSAVAVAPAVAWAGSHPSSVYAKDAPSPTPPTWWSWAWAVSIPQIFGTS